MPDPYFSEIKYLGGPALDFIEVAVDAGTDVSSMVVTIYNPNGTVRSSNSLSGLTSTTIAGRDVYVIESGSPGSFTGLGKTNGLSLSDGATVHDFVSFNDNVATVTATAGPANGLTSREIGMAGAGESLETFDNGSTYSVQTTPNSGTIPCLTAGTLVMTSCGEKIVEDLRPGMRIVTGTGEHVPILKALSSLVSQHKLAANPKLYPIRISAHALGNGLPKRDLLVSRQHRMLVSSPIVERMFGEKSVLIAAIRLLDVPGIYIDKTVQSVEYFHLLFDHHQIIFAEGAPTESLYLGKETFNALPKAVVQEIQALFPEICMNAKNTKAARHIPRNHRQKNLISRHVKNDMPVLRNHRISAKLKAVT